MPDYIGNIEVPEIVPSGVFPIVPDYGYGHALEPQIAIHRFGSANAKIEQRFLLGTGARRFIVRRSQMRESDRVALRDFWETKYGPYGVFTYNAPNDDGNGTTPFVCRFANEPLSWEFLCDAISSVGITLIEIPGSSPSYDLNQTVTRFPPPVLKEALLSQIQEIIPLVKIQVREAGYPAIYVSDRRCTVGGQLYLARLLEFDGIAQSIGSECDEAQFILGNADRVMRDLANDTDLLRAALEFSLFHVGTGIKLDLWKGEIVDWKFDDGPEFRVTAADGIYELNLPYPTRKVSRRCWKCFDDAASCPFTSESTGMDYEHFPNADPETCDKGYETENGCLAHGMKRYFGGILAEPQAVRIKDNSTGVWGFGRSTITSVSLVAESVYDQVIPEIYTDGPMPVNCKIAAGREESDFYDALGIVGEGPLVFGSGHKLDGQYHHGYPGLAGLRYAQGFDPALAGDFFSLGELGDKTGGDWRKVYYGGGTYKDNFAAGTAFLELRRKDEKGLQLTQVSGHEMQAVVASGLHGWVWSAPGVRSQQVLSNPVWIAVNMLLRARGLRFADAATAEQYFDVGAAIAAAAICNESVEKLVGSGYETQFKFRGVIQEEKPLRDWIQEILMNCLGYFTFAFGKLKIGIRANSSAVEAFTEGNIIFQSLELAALKPSFNHLTANFADEDFDFVANAVTLYDIDHAGLIGGATAPLFLKSNLNLSGTSSKSQAARIITARLREELGGITPAQWKAARQISFRTTVLALNTEPGMVCSMTHPSMPDGSGEFRVTSWRLNKDYSIDIQGRTTVDEMYDMIVGPKPADVMPSPVPVEPPGWNQRATGAIDGDTAGNPTLTELFVQDDLNPDLYRRKIKVEFVPPPVEYNDLLPCRAQISDPEVEPTGGSIPGGQTLLVELCARADGKDGLASDNLVFEIPAGTNTNKIGFLCRLPAGATHYVIRVGSHLGRTYALGTPIESPGTDWFPITITDVSTLDSASLSPDPRFHHVRVFYYYDSSPGVLREAGKTSGPTENQFIFEPEVPKASDSKITVIVCSENAGETERYPIAYSPKAELALTKDTGNPAGASDLEILTSSDDAAVPAGCVVFEFNRETSNYRSIAGVAAVLSAELPAEGPYKAERDAHPSCVIETGSCQVEAGSRQIAVTRSANPDVVGRVLLIYTDDASPDSDLEGEIVAAEGENSLSVNTPFHKTGTFAYAIVKRWWDIGGGDTANKFYQWFPIDQLGDVEQAVWRTPPVPAPAGTWYASLYARNLFGVGTRLTAGPKTVAGAGAPPSVPDGLEVAALASGLAILFGVEARKWNEGITEAEFRAKFFAAGTNYESVDLRTPAEGGTLEHNGTTAFVVAGIVATQYGAQYQITSAAQGVWYYAWRLRNAEGWSVWSDGNDTPRYARDRAATEDPSMAADGPPADWTVAIQPAAVGHAVVVTVSRPATRGKKILAWAVQIKDATMGAWRALDAGAGAAVTKFDGTAVGFNASNDNRRFTRVSGQGLGTAAVGDLVLLDYAGGSWALDNCNWATIEAIEGNDPATATWFEIAGRFNNAVQTDLRLKIVKPPWEWNTEGYLGDQPNRGLWSKTFWAEGGDVSTQTFVSDPIAVPAGTDLSHIQARVWFDNGFSRSDGGVHSDFCPAGGGGSGSAIQLDASSGYVYTDAALGYVFTFTMTTDTMLMNPTNARDGQPIVWIVRQDAVGGHALSLDGKFRLGDQVEVVVSDMAGSRTLVGCVYSAAADQFDMVPSLKGY
jgi:hypothetical protein